MGKSIPGDSLSYNVTPKFNEIELNKVLEELNLKKNKLHRDRLLLEINLAKEKLDILKIESTSKLPELNSYILNTLRYIVKPPIKLHQIVMAFLLLLGSDEETLQV